MTTLINMCPNCKGKDIKKTRKGKYASTASGLVFLGLLSLMFPFVVLIGGLLIVIGIVMGCISETTYKCRSCNAEWV